MAKKQAKKEKQPQKKQKASKTKKKAKNALPADDGIVIIDEQIQEDKEAELEARKAYLEEARSQEVDD